MHKKASIFIYIAIVCYVVGCTSFNSPGLNSNPDNVMAAPTATIPSGNSKDDVPHDEEIEAWARSLMEAHPNGVTIGVLPSYKNKYADWFETFFVEEQGAFLGELTVGTGLPEPRQIAIVCLLDHIQIPCTPDSSKEYIVTVSGTDLVFLPLSLTDLEPGLHDLDLLVVRDPYKDGLNSAGSSIRFSTVATVGTYNILAGGLLVPPQVEPITPGKAGETVGESGILKVSENRKLTDELGNIPVWMESEGTAGERLKFYLHFNSGVFDENGDTIAVMAFLNYEQIPLHYENRDYTPLYVERKLGSHQIVPVSIRLPDTPGEYELIVIARTDTFSPVELQRPDGDPVGTTESRRIKITVR